MAITLSEHNQLRLTLVLSGVLLVGCNTTVLTSTQITSQNELTFSSQYGFERTYGYYWLPRGKFRLLIKREKLNDPCIAELKETVYEPDPRYLFRLDYNRSLTYADKITIEVEPNGLLKTVQVETDDRMVAIAQKLVDIGKEAAKASIALPMIEAGADAALNPFQVDVLMLPPDTDESKKLLSDLITFLKSKQCPVVHIDLPIKPLTTESSTRADRIENSKGLTGKGLFYRPLLPYEIRFEDSDGKTIFLKKTVYLPNSSPIFFHEVSRAHYAKKTTGLSFQNGLLTTIKTDIPSTVEGVLDIPLSVAKAAASVPGELIQLKVDLTNKNNSLLEAQNSQISAQLHTIEATRSLLQAEEELRKLKEELAKKKATGTE